MTPDLDVHLARDAHSVGQKSLLPFRLSHSRFQSYSESVKTSEAAAQTDKRQIADFEGLANV